MDKINTNSTEDKYLQRERRASEIFAAQEKNKKSICRKSSRKVIKQEKPQVTKDREQLIMHYAYLVNWVVSRLPVASLKGMDKDDLIGYGTVGLIESVDRFDATKGASFESFAVTRIRGSIYDQLRSADHLTRGSRKKVKNLSRTINELEVKLGRHPKDEEIAQELDITLADLRAIQREAQIGIFSLDETRHESEEGTSLSDMVPGDAGDMLGAMEENELKDLLIKAVDCLPEREKTVIGLYHYKRLTFKEIAEVMEFSESRASQLHARAISLLKSKLVKE